ncbi:hypothetical protein AC578_9916 [Pseudocercospora eumusae]|uniref:Uncharacterized protein n=1 Tax=Pseudocercospora eumusae TaxID=321146 RepID=A0A139HB55_9PEZI|nr:hypothetical protein AC578_9916 [Pseudocercospora eumusae]
MQFLLLLHEEKKSEPGLTYDDDRNALPAWNPNVADSGSIKAIKMSRMESVKYTMKNKMENCFGRGGEGVVQRDSSEHKDIIDNVWVTCKA